MKSIAEIVAGHAVVICAGSGGVGKTTTAAALSLYAAEQGRRTMVITIDPARRLADALGLRDLGNQARIVALDARGTLSAMMLDQKGAWDQLVERHAPSPEVRERVLANRFYQHLSQSFAGSQDYMALEQLSALHESGQYDLIVVDTPPTQHALDFLDAPQRLADFLDRQIVRWFVKPYVSAGWSTLRAVNRTVGALFRRLEDATGVTALVEVSDFFASMSGLFDGVGERVQRVNALLRSKQTAFVLIASAEEQVLTEAEYFCRKVGELEVPLRGVVFNRVHRMSSLPRRALDEAAIAKSLARLVGAERARQLAQGFLRYETLARGDTARLEAFRKQLPKRTAVATVPTFDEDLHDLEGLRRMIPHLVAG